MWLDENNNYHWASNLNRLITTLITRGKFLSICEYLILHLPNSTKSTLHREVLMFPSTFRTKLHKVLDNLLSLNLLKAGNVVLHDLERSLPTSSILWHYNGHWDFICIQTCVIMKPVSETVIFFSAKMEPLKQLRSTSLQKYFVLTHFGFKRNHLSNVTYHIRAQVCICIISPESKKFI